MESIEYQAGLFEHVSKMSRLVEPSGDTSAPAVRYRTSVTTPIPSDLASLPPMDNTSLMNTYKPHKTAILSERKKVDIPVPVKLRLVHPLSNQTAPDVIPSSDSDGNLPFTSVENDENKQVPEKQTGEPQIEKPKQNDSKKVRVQRSKHRLDKKRQKEERRKNKLKKKEQEELWMKTQEQIEEVLQLESADEPFRSPTSKMMQEARHQRWKKTSWQPPEEPVKEKKIGRNMRAAPLHRTPSEGSSTSRMSGLKPHEASPSQLNQQGFQHMAQDILRPPPYSISRHSPGQTQGESQLAADLLNEVFSLANSGQSGPHSVPVSPPSYSDLGAESAHTEPMMSGIYTPEGQPITAQSQHGGQPITGQYQQGGQQLRGQYNTLFQSPDNLNHLSLEAHGSLKLPDGPVTFQQMGQGSDQR